MRDHDPIAAAGRSAKRRVFALGALALLIAIWTFMALAVDAEAYHVACGATITEDTVLDSDLVDCPENGVVIAANDVRLDLNGHTIRGDSSGTYDTDNGVLVVGRARVTIANGHVEGFFAQILARSSEVLLDGLDVRCGSDGCFHPFAIGIAGEAGRVAISGSRVTNTPTGILLSPATGARIEGNVIADNGGGIFLEEGSGSVVEGNVFSDNGSAVGLFDNFGGHVVEENLISDGSLGVVTQRSTGNQIARNHLTNVSGGISVSGDSFENTVSRNRIVGGRMAVLISSSLDNAVLHNVVIGSGTGIEVFDSGRSAVVGNRLQRTTETGISLTGRTGTTEMSRNRVVAAGGDGIFVDLHALESAIAGNTAVRNGDDGIDVENAATSLTGNRAHQNADLGIEAVEGVFDGGGNRARGNGNELQCTGVVCR